MDGHLDPGTVGEPGDRHGVSIDVDIPEPPDDAARNRQPPPRTAKSAATFTTSPTQTPR